MQLLVPEAAIHVIRSHKQHKTTASSTANDLTLVSGYGEEG